ncbi:MAG: hypothetical protein ACREUY_09245 [Burkholderiales bacterium]
MTSVYRLSPLTLLLLVGACTTMPEGPSVMVLPGTGKSFDQFRADDFECRQFASGQVGGTTAGQASSDSGVRSAALGTLLGAALGAAVNGGSGAAVGAGTGLALGALAGTGAAESSGYTVQQRYNNGYVQCMYAKGHRVPVSGRFTYSNPPAPANYASPLPPPPPPRYSSPQ